MLTVTSTAFADGTTIPVKYCAHGVDGALNISLPLSWSAPPEDTRSVLVTVYALDTDAPSLPGQPDAAEIDRAVAGHTLAMGTITGVFGR